MQLVHGYPAVARHFLQKCNQQLRLRLRRPKSQKQSNSNAFRSPDRKQSDFGNTHVGSLIGVKRPCRELVPARDIRRNISRRPLVLLVFLTISNYPTKFEHVWTFLISFIFFIFVSLLCLGFSGSTARFHVRNLLQSLSLSPWKPQRSNNGFSISSTTFKGTSWLQITVLYIIIYTYFLFIYIYVHTYT